MNWTESAFFYHIYPLGALGAPESNPSGPPVSRLPEIQKWTDHLLTLGVDAVYLGPVWDSESHGYDTRDYRTVDPRLGTNADLKRLIAHWRGKGIRTVLDGVFNHTGRSFFAFDDLCRNGRHSSRRDWYYTDFSHGNQRGDSFCYQCWEGHDNLPKLNLDNPEVRDYLLETVRIWMDEFGIAGIRLDAADCLSHDFNRSLRAFVGRKDPDFLLLGELIHGDYRTWVNGSMFHSCTNYEVYKDLWSSHNDANYFEPAWSLNRLFGPEGLYRGHSLYNFGDNHDVHRLASILADPVHLYPLTGLLFTIPGIPSVYYGSESGIPGRRTTASNATS